MTGTKRFTKSIIAAIIAIVIAASSISMISATSASAASYSGSAQANASLKSAAAVVEKTTALNTLAKAYCFKALGKSKQGYNWTYKTNNDIVKVKCKYDFTAHKYTFKLVGTAKGTAKLTLKYRKDDKTVVKVPMTIKVDAQKNIMRVA